jgi:hypothetical protein
MRTALFIALAPIDADLQTILFNLVARLASRLATSNHCTIGLNLTETSRDILNDYFIFFAYAPLSINFEYIDHVRLPWIDRRSIAAYIEMILGEKFELVTDNPSMAQSNETTSRLPIYGSCDDYFIENIHRVIERNSPNFTRIIILSNVVYECLTVYQSTYLNNLPLSDYLAIHTNTSIDYVYFNNRTFENTFTKEQLYRSLLTAFPTSQRSANHIYFVKSILDLDSAWNQIAFCADQIATTAIVGSKKTEFDGKDNNKEERDNSATFRTILIGIAAGIALLFFALITFLFYFRKQIVERRKHREFVRQVKLNEKHQFEYIKKMWKVPEENVDIDYETIIGKGVQSIVYKG